MYQTVSDIVVSGKFYREPQFINSSIELNTILSAYIRLEQIAIENGRTCTDVILEIRAGVHRLRLTFTRVGINILFV